MSGMLPNIISVFCDLSFLDKIKRKRHGLFSVCKLLRLEYLLAGLFDLIVASLFCSQHCAGLFDPVLACHVSIFLTSLFCHVHL